MMTNLRCDSCEDYIDAYFDCAMSEHWYGAIWRAQITYDRGSHKIFNRGDPTWEYAEPNESFEESGTAPPEVLALYEKHKDELFALLLAQRMK